MQGVVRQPARKAKKTERTSTRSWPEEPDIWTMRSHRRKPPETKTGLQTGFQRGASASVLCRSSSHTTFTTLRRSQFVEFWPRVVHSRLGYESCKLLQVSCVLIKGRLQDR